MSERPGGGANQYIYIYIYVNIYIHGQRARLRQWSVGTERWRRWPRRWRAPGAVPTTAAALSRPAGARSALCRVPNITSDTKGDIISATAPTFHGAGQLVAVIRGGRMILSLWHPRHEL